MRLFLALNLPPDVRQALWEAAGPVRANAFPVAWVRPEGIHMTLKFLGEVADEREATIRAALAQSSAGARALSLSVEGFGVFPHFAGPRVIWAGVNGEPALELLRHRTEQEFAAIDFPIDGHPFRPHLTLGRARRSARPRDFAGLEEALAGLSYEATVAVETVDLMQSATRPAGTEYLIRHRERLL